MALTVQERNSVLALLPDDVLKEYVNGGISDDQLEQLAIRTGVRKTKEQAAPKPKPRSLDNSRNALDTVVDAVQSGLRRTGSGLIQQGIDSDALRKREESDPWYQRDIFDYVGFGPDERARADADIASKLQGYKERETYSDIQARMEAQAAAEEQAVQKDLSTIRNPVARTLAQGATDAAGSPLSYLSVFGGAAGAVSGLDSYARTYRDARKAGVSIDDAQKIAREKQAVESAIGMIPAAKLLGPLSRLGRGVTGGNLSKFGGRMATNMAGEGVNEVLTEGINSALDFERAITTNNERVRKYSEAALPKDISDAAVRTFVAGAMGGGALATPSTMLEISAENGRLAGDMIQRHAKNKDAFPSRRKPAEIIQEEADRPRSNAIEPTTDLFGEVPQGPRDSEERLRGQEPSPREGQESVYNRIVSELDTQIGDEEISLAPLREAQERAALGEMPLDADTEFELAQRENRLKSLKAARERASRRAGPTVQGSLGLDSPEQPAPKPAPGNIQTRGGDTYYTPDGQTRSKVYDSAASEATSALAKSRKTDEKNAKAAMKKARDKLRTQLTNEAKQMQDVTDEVRVKHVAAGLAEFDRGRKWEDFVVQPTAKPAGRAPARSNPNRQPAVPVMSTDELMKALGPDATLQQKSSEVRNTGVTADQVVQTIRAKIGKSQSNTAAKLIGDGNLVVVNDASEIPSDATQTTTAGFYDGKRTYVVANQLRADNIMGDMLSIAAHEVKHAADHKPGERVKATMGNFIGASANTQINRKIEAMAASGDPIAREVVKAAKAGSTPETYALELPAYFINFTRAKRDLAPAHRRVMDNVVSAVRNAAKRTIGSEDVNLNDVAYLSDKLLRETAEGGERIDAPATAQSMVYDENATGFNEADEAGETYISKDQVKKFVRPDNESTLAPNAKELMTEANKSFDSVSMADILSHDELYKQVPEARDIRVNVITFSRPKQYGAYYPGDQTIGVAERVLENPAELRKTLLHEIQHWIQDRHAQRNQQWYEENMTDEEREFANRFDRVDQDLTNLAELMDKALRTVAQGLPARRRDAIIRHLDNENAGDVARIRNAVKSQGDFLLDNSETIDELYNEMEDKSMEYSAMLERRNEISNRLYAEYEANITEAEAFFTEDNADNPEPAANPEQGATRRPVQLSSEPNLAFDARHLRAALDRLRRPDNKVMDVMRKSFSGYGALGRTLAAMKELADGFAAHRAHNGMNHFHEINRGITQAAKLEVAAGRATDQETAEKNVRDHVEQVMKTMEKEDDPQRRISMMNALVRRYPSLKGFPRAVQEVNELTRTLVRQILESNPNPTEDERRLMQTMMNNTFRYTTRMYAAFQGEAGRDYSKRVKKEYDKAMKAVKNGKAVPPKYAESFKKWKNAAEYLISNDLSIPSEEDIGGTSTDRLTRLYDTWIGDAARVKANAKTTALANGMTKREADQAAREALIAGLLERAPDISNAEMQGMADNLIIGMLGLQDAGGPFAQYYRGFKQDRGILEKREQLPQEIRELFGEITDPATRLAVTIAKQGELAGRTRLLLDMKHRGEGTWVVKSADRGKPGNEKFSVQLTGKGYGPLDGYYTTPDIASSISDSLEMFSTMGDALAKGYQNSDALAMAMARGATQGLVKMAGLQKLLTVVADLYNMGMNAFGSPIVLFANGIYNPLQWTGGAKVAAQVIWDTGMQGGVELSPATQDAIRYGVLDSARVQEIRRTPQQFVRNLISTSPRAVSAVKSGTSRAVRTGIEAFAMADAWVKIVAFQERTETLRKFYKAEGIEKTDHELKAEAADQIKDTNITYSRTGAAIRAAERVGATTFMPYFVSVPRAIAYNVALASKDMIRAIDAKTPEAKMTLGMAAVRRMSGTAVATAGVVYAMKAIAAAVNDEDEDKLAAMQKLMFPDARFADSFFLGYDEKGIPMFARFSRIDPFGPVNDFMRILFDEHTDAPEKKRHVVDMFKDLLITNRVLVTGSQLALDIVADADVDIASKETKIERVGPKTTAFIKDKLEGIPGLDGRDSESLISFIDSFMPGITDMFDPKNNGIAKESEEGAATLGAIITYTGGRMDLADPGLAAFAAGKKLDDIRRDGRRRQADGLKAGESIETLQDRFLEDAQEEYDAMRDVADVWEGMREGIELSPRQAAKIMKDDGKLKETDIRNLHYGQLSMEAEQWIARYSRLISVDSQRKSAIGKDDRKLTPEEKQKIREYLLNMRALGYKVQE